MLRFDDFFFFLHNVPENVFFSSIPELPKTEVQYSKTGNDIYDFSSDEQQCRFKERFRIHLVAQFIVFLFFLFMFV